MSKRLKYSANLHGHFFSTRGRPCDVTVSGRFHSMRLRFYLHGALWCALFALFVGISIPNVGRAVLENKIGPASPNHSTDSYLEGLTRVRNGSELFSSLIDTLPQDESIVIFVDSESSPSKFLGMIVAYLSWPHRVKTVAVTPATFADEVAAVKQDSVGAAVFCALKPPVWVKNKSDFGTRITFVPIASLTPNP